MPKAHDLCFKTPVLAPQGLAESESTWIHMQTLYALKNAESDSRNAIKIWNDL